MERPDFDGWTPEEAWEHANVRAERYRKALEEIAGLPWAGNEPQPRSSSELYGTAKDIARRALEEKE